MEDLLASHRKERKELIAQTQKMKHGVSQSDKKKKKEINAEVARMLAELDLKHEKQIKDFETQSISKELNEETNEILQESEQVAYKSLPNLIEKNMNISENVDLDNLSNEKDHVAEESNICSTEQRKKLSKAQKRRNKKALLNKEREKAIEEQEIKNLSGDKFLESQKMQEKLNKRCLAIHEIPSDGNCLYKAIEHQLSLENIKTTVEFLREQTSKYLLSHIEEYLPFITCPETGDVLTEEQYVKYCEDIAKTCAWGGYVEIQALSHIYQRPIEIIQADSPSVISGEDYSNPRLLLSYHKYIYGLGEHYNSVIPLSE